jgi:hypothetical protein
LLLLLPMMLMMMMMMMMMCVLHDGWWQSALEKAASEVIPGDSRHGLGGVAPAHTGRAHRKLSFRQVLFAAVGSSR